MKIKKIIACIFCLFISFNVCAVENNKNDEQPKISVVMPIYNTDRYLAKSLLSLLDQTFNDFEIICVNDGSTDKSADILEKFAKKDSRIKIINQKNQYAGVARNNGLAVAKGKYIIFLDSDDYFYPDMLEKLYIKSEKTDADITMCKHDVAHYDNSKISNKVGFNIVHKDVFNMSDIDDILSFAPVVPWDKLYRRKFIIENNLTFSPTKTSNDIKFVIYSYILANSITQIEYSLINHNYKNPTSVTFKRGKFAPDIITVIDEIYSYLKDNNYLDKQNIKFVPFASYYYTYNLSFQIDDELLIDFADKIAQTEHFYLIEDMLNMRLVLLKNNKDTHTDLYKNLSKVMQIINLKKKDENSQ